MAKKGSSRKGEGRGAGPRGGGVRAEGVRGEVKPVALDPVVRQLENLRKIRTRPEARREVGETIKPEVVRLERVRAALEGVGEKWEEIVPRELRERCWALGVSRRVLSVAVEDAAAGYELSMWLRGGGEQAIVNATGRRVSRVKVEVRGGQIANGK